MNKHQTKIIRMKKEKNFSVVDNRFLRRKDLSWKAKGIMTYILSLPDDWTIYLEEVMKNATDGSTSFRNGWKELTEKGYVTRYPVRTDDDSKISYWETVIKEYVSADFVLLDNLHVDNQHIENAKLLSTDITKDLKTKEIRDSHDSAKAKYGDESPYLKLAVLLHDLAKQNNQKIRKPNFQTWADDIRKLVELDDNSLKEVEKVLRFSQADNFWKRNILSAGKLRVQFPKLWGDGDFDGQATDDSGSVDSLWEGITNEG